MTDFWTRETYAIVKAMKATGNQTGVIAQWKAAVQEWALRNENHADARSIHAWLPHWQIRPFYTANELAPIWPALAIAIGFTTRWPAVLKSPRRLANELDFAGLPYFFMNERKYYIVERLHFWQSASQKERENAFNQ